MAREFYVTVLHRNLQIFFVDCLLKVHKIFEAFGFFKKFPFLCVFFSACIQSFIILAKGLKIQPVDITSKYKKWQVINHSWPVGWPAIIFWVLNYQSNCRMHKAKNNKIILGEMLDFNILVHWFFTAGILVYLFLTRKELKLILNLLQSRWLENIFT